MTPSLLQTIIITITIIIFTMISIFPPPVLGASNARCLVSTINKLSFPGFGGMHVAVKKFNSFLEITLLAAPLNYLGMYNKRSYRRYLF